MIASAAKPVWKQATRVAQLGQSCHSMQDFSLSEGNDLALLQLLNPLITTTGSGPCSDFGLVGNVRLVGKWLPHPPASVWVSGYGRDPATAGPQEERRQAVVLLLLLTAETRSRLRRFLAHFQTSRQVTVSPAHESNNCPAAGFAPKMDSAYATHPNCRAPGLEQVSESSDNAAGAGGIYTQLGRADVLSWLKAGVASSAAQCRP